MRLGKAKNKNGPPEGGPKIFECDLVASIADGTEYGKKTQQIRSGH